MAFEVELAFERVVDGLDDLTQRLVEPGPGAGRLALARAAAAGAIAGQGGLKLAAVVVLVREDDLPGAPRTQGRLIQDAQEHLAFIGFDAGERKPGGQAVQGSKCSRSPQK